MNSNFQKKPSRWFTVLAFLALVLMLDIILLEIRHSIISHPNSKETLFPITLFVVAGLVLIG